ncbi:HAD family hydrolase [Ottowia thiooxydans]|uniref:HAD family hydrolase n=1 Tax=Ottowia thiooxydans TaxID=219182 RepID=UPI0004086BB6|nr:HAD-IA family hydrolase [Ottowia thiooxydans]
MAVFDGIRCVLFDLDGTLIDSAPDLGLAADEMRVARGLPSLPLAQYRSVAGSGARGMLSVAFGLTPADQEYGVLREEFLNNYERRMTYNTEIFSGVKELLSSLGARGLTWGVVTNKGERFTYPLTATMPLFTGAVTIVCGDTTPHAKPHPAPILEAMRRAGFPPDQCIYVGDDERDIVAGKAAGVGTVAANYGYLGAEADVASWQADAVITHPGDLLTLLS